MTKPWGKHKNKPQNSLCSQHAIWSRDLFWDESLSADRRRGEWGSCPHCAHGRVSWVPGPEPRAAAEGRSSERGAAALQWGSPLGCDRPVLHELSVAGSPTSIRCVFQSCYASHLLSFARVKFSTKYVALNAMPGRLGTKEPRGASSKMALRCEYPCRIISRSLIAVFS